MINTSVATTTIVMMMPVESKGGGVGERVEG